jgi:hypothetical protein
VRRPLTPPSGATQTISDTLNGMKAAGATVRWAGAEHSSTSKLTVSTSCGKPWVVSVTCCKINGL